jgi:hypothetical protein
MYHSPLKANFQNGGPLAQQKSSLTNSLFKARKGIIQEDIERDMGTFLDEENIVEV